MVTLNTETSVKAFPNAPSSPPSPKPEPVSNAVMQVLVDKGNAYKNFGQCIIFMLNRERMSTPILHADITGEMSLQLLILKLLYLIFTTPQTYEYFYSNDLRVLVDVFIRELCDLPDDAESVSPVPTLSDTATTYIPSRSSSSIISHSATASATL